MKNLSNELKKMDTYTGIEYAQRITELYKMFTICLKFQLTNKSAR